MDGLGHRHLNGRGRPCAHHHDASRGIATLPSWISSGSSKLMPPGRRPSPSSPPPQVEFFEALILRCKIQNEGYNLPLGVKDAVLQALLLAAQSSSLGPPQVFATCSSSVPLESSFNIVFNGWISFHRIIVLFQCWFLLLC